MLWVALFVVGLIGLLAGLVPWILNGGGFRSILATLLGAVIVAVGAAGTVARPQMDRFADRIFSHGDATSVVAIATPEPGPAKVAEPLAADPAAPAAPPADAGAARPESAPPRVRVVGTEKVTAPPQPPTVPSADKDESQLPVVKPSVPVIVTTTSVPGNEVDPLAAASADTGNGAPAAPADPSAPPPANAPTAPAAPDASAVLAALADQQPRDESAFTQAMQKGRDSFAKADGAARTAAQTARAAAACKAIPATSVKGWVGAVKEVSKDEGGRQMLTVALSDGTLVKTWNNAMSDADDKTLIEAGTPLAGSLDGLKVGDPLRFSGTFFSDDVDCVRSTRLGEDQSMMEPSYLFRFTALQKL